MPIDTAFAFSAAHPNPQVDSVYRDFLACWHRPAVEPPG
jgi:hypothetical protein